MNGNNGDNSSAFFIGGCSGSGMPPSGEVVDVLCENLLPLLRDHVRSEFGMATTAFGIVSRVGGKLTGISIDQGTGSSAVVEWLDKIGVEDVWVLMTHFHFDHVAGIHYGAMYRPTNGIYAPVLPVGRFGDVCKSLFAPALWPISPKDRGFDHAFHDFELGDDIPIMHGVKTMASRHSGGCAIYRITLPDGDIVIGTDVELADPGYMAAFARFISGAKIVLLDMQYRHSEYLGKSGICGGPAVPRIGWGHSTPTMAHEMLRLTEKKPETVIVVHHDPARTDEDFFLFQEEIKGELHPLGINVEMGKDNYPHCDVSV